MPAKESTWTEQRIRAYGVRMPFYDAVEAIHGARESKAREMLRRGELDPRLRIIQTGRRRWVPVQDVLLVLGLVDHRTGGSAA